MEVEVEVLKSCDNNESNNDYANATEVKAMLTDYSLLNNKEI